MTSEEFNLKYQDYLEQGHYGLGIDIPELTKWLDEKFQLFIQKPGFKYSQVKLKFGMGRFYCEGLETEEEREVEKYITDFFKKQDERRS